MTEGEVGCGVCIMDTARGVRFLTFFLFRCTRGNDRGEVVVCSRCNVRGVFVGAGGRGWFDAALGRGERVGIN